MNLAKISENIVFYESDFENGNLKFNSVLKKFEHIAVNHAESVGVGFEDMLKQNLLWVTLRIKYQILNNPLPNEQLLLTTCASGKNALEFDRDFIIESKRGILIKGTSKWCLIDKDTRHISELLCLSPFDNILQKPIFEEKFLKTEIFDTNNMQPNFEYQVRNEDIDKNGHMNNTIYAKILQIPNNKLINFFQINFMHEALVNQKILVYKKEFENKTIFIGKFDNDTVSFTAEIRF